VDLGTKKGCFQWRLMLGKICRKRCLHVFVLFLIIKLYTVKGCKAYPSLWNLKIDKIGNDHNRYRVGIGEWGPGISLLFSTSWGPGEASSCSTKLLVYRVYVRQLTVRDPVSTCSHLFSGKSWGKSSPHWGDWGGTEWMLWIVRSGHVWGMCGQRIQYLALF
jgi:hypothetical protein